MSTIIRNRSCFDYCLPEVNRCFFCIGLECGSIIIGIIGLVVGGPGAMVFFVWACSFSLIEGILFYFIILICIIMFIVMILFLIGICYDWACGAELYLWFVLVTNILALITLIVAGILGSCLVFLLIGIVVMIINIAICFWFMMVVNTYKKLEMY